MDFDNASWRDAIPSEPGWYLIKTNTPLVRLKSVNPPDLGYKAHINIPQAINNALILQNLGVAINQSGTEDYVVYTGEADNLKARAREHECGHRKTYCLGLSKYKEDVGGYRWAFCYVAASSCLHLLGVFAFGLVIEAASGQFHHLAPPPDGNTEAPPYPDDLPFL